MGKHCSKHPASVQSHGTWHGIITLYSPQQQHLHNISTARHKDALQTWMSLKHHKTSSAPSVSAPEELHNINSAAVPVGRELLTSAQNTLSCFMVSLIESGGAGGGGRRAEASCFMRPLEESSEGAGAAAAVCFCSTAQTEADEHWYPHLNWSEIIMTANELVLWWWSSAGGASCWPRSFPTSLKPQHSHCSFMYYPKKNLQPCSPCVYSGFSACGSRPKTGWLSSSDWVAASQAAAEAAAAAAATVLA